MMPSGTMTYTSELTIVTCWCGMTHAVPEALRDYQEQATKARKRAVIANDPLPLAAA